VVIDVLANDTDPEGDALAFAGVVQPRHGKVFTNEDGMLTYRPDMAFEDRPVRLLGHRREWKLHQGYRHDRGEVEYST
jgi:hypothetical protein